MDGSIYKCSEPGFFPHEKNCIDFYVCIEILPGVLIADQVKNILLYFWNNQ